MGTARRPADRGPAYHRGVTFTEWRSAHPRWNSAALFLGVMVGVTLSHDVTESLLPRLLVSCAMCLATMLALTAVAWFIASDGRRARQ